MFVLLPRDLAVALFVFIYVRDAEKLLERASGEHVPQELFTRAIKGRIGPGIRHNDCLLPRRHYQEHSNFHGKGPNGVRGGLLYATGRGKPKPAVPEAEGESRDRATAKPRWSGRSRYCRS